MNEMIEEIKSLIQKKPLVMETVLILDVLAALAERIQTIENRLSDMNKGAANGSKKEESGFNIG